MKKSKNSTSQKVEKREVVFEAAADVFAQYGFRRTSMNDIAQAAGISRPALYLMFDNKEDLFRELASYRQNQGIDLAISTLAGNAPIVERVTAAILAFERIFYEPIAQSPHGAELMDISISIAADCLMKDIERLIKSLVQALADAESNGEITFVGMPMQATAYVRLLMSSIGGLKKQASSTKVFRRQISEVVSIFLKSVSPASTK